MRFRYLLIAAMVLSLSFPMTTSVKIGYHDVDIVTRSDPVTIPAGLGRPDNGSFISASHIAIPFSGAEGGRGALALMVDSDLDISQVLKGSVPGAFLPKELFWSMDADGDGAEDLVVSDRLGNVYMLDEVLGGGEGVIDPDTAVLESMNGTLALSDVSGDDIADVIELSEDGKVLRAVLGPLDEPTGSFEMELPFVCSIIHAGADLNGDGLPEIALSGKEGTNGTLIVYDGDSLAELAVLRLPGATAWMSYGDLDGDRTDDLVLLFPNGTDHGRISVCFGPGIRGTEWELLDVWSVLGTVSSEVHEDMVVTVIDLDGDRADDLIMGDASASGSKGRVSLFYGGSDKDFGTDRLYSFPDADIVGHTAGSGLGSSIIASIDHDGDLLPDVLLGSEDGLVRWSLPPNVPPSVPTLLGFIVPGTDTLKERAQFGERVGIRLIATGGNPEYPDVVRVGLSTRDPFKRWSWTNLRETGADSSLYTGDILLLSGSVQGRSISVREGVIVDLTLGALYGGSLTVQGRVGQDDPPYIEPPDPDDLLAREGEEFVLMLIAHDPEDDPLEWGGYGIPTWLTLDDGTLRGTPSDGDAGRWEMVINASSRGRNGSVLIAVNVLNIPPSIEVTALPRNVMEREAYSGSISFSGRLSKFEQEGPSDRNWLVLYPDGRIDGEPRNSDVGSWAYNATVTDSHGANASLVWTVEVLNKAPSLMVPVLPEADEGKAYTIDLDEPDEGDGLTSYSVDGDPPFVVINKTTGILSFKAPIGSTHLTFSATVEDGNGLSDRSRIEIEVVDVAPVLIGSLPSNLLAGELVTLDLNSSEEGAPGSYYRFDSELPFLHYWNATFDELGLFQVRPWNSDEGNHRLNITFGTGLSLSSYYVWNMTVRTNPSFIDPSIMFEVRGLDRDRLLLGLIGSNGTLASESVVLTVDDENGSPLMGPIMLDGRFSGEWPLDISNLSGRIYVAVTMVVRDSELGVRNVTYGRLLDIPESREGDGQRNGLLPLIITVVLILLIAAMVSSLLLMERTSYLVQSLIARGGRGNEEVLLAAIQGRPGTRFRELQASLSMSRKEIVSALTSLEAKRHIRAVPDGTRLRFLPTVGSFVKGPLALDRYQGRLLEMMKGEGVFSPEDLSKRSGLSVRRVNKELSLLGLKGAVSSTSMEGKKVYYLDRKQRARVNAWARSKVS